MQSMIDKKRGFETACVAAVKARNFAEAAKAASGAADCAEILAARTTGIVSEAYAKEVASWRRIARKLEGHKDSGGPRGTRPASDGGEEAADGSEWLVAEKPDITFDDIAGMEDAKRVINEMVLYPMKSPEKARALGLNPGGGVLLFGPPDLAARRRILELNVKEACLSDDVRLDDVASAPDGASGSDMAAVVSAAKRAALARAIRDDADPVLTNADFDEARRRIPLSITEGILAPYRKFIAERF